MLNKIMAYINNALKNTRDDTARFAANDIGNNKVMALLSYIWLCCLIPMFAAKNSPYALYHARQGLVLAIVETVVAIVLGLLSAIPLIGVIFAIARVLILLACVVLALIGINNCLNEKARELPFMSQLMQLIARR